MTTKPSSRALLWNIRKQWLSAIGIHIFGMAAILIGLSAGAIFDGNPIRLAPLLAVAVYAASIGYGISRWEKSRIAHYQLYQRGTSLQIAEVASKEFTAMLADAEKSRNA